MCHHSSKSSRLYRKFHLELEGLILESSKKKVSSGFIGSIIGASAGACSCGSIGFAVISVFGAVGGAAATSFLANYEIPLRLLSIAILVATYFYMIRGLTRECKVDFSSQQK